jgi:hypothetical protein
MQLVKGGHCKAKVPDKSQASQGLSDHDWLRATQFLSWNRNYTPVRILGGTSVAVANQGHFICSLQTAKKNLT